MDDPESNSRCWSVKNDNTSIDNFYHCGSTRNHMYTVGSINCNATISTCPRALYSSYRARAHGVVNYNATQYEVIAVIAAVWVEMLIVSQDRIVSQNS